MDYRDFINTNMNDVITALNGSITPAPVNSELYRNFLNRKADDIITALNGTITPPPIGDELYRDFIERKFDDVISGIGSYIPPVSFPSVSGAVCSFDSQYAGLPLKSHTVDIDYTGNAISNCFVVNMADDTNISYFQGLLNGTYGFVDLGTLDWGYSHSVFNSSVISTLNAPTNNIICPLYETISYNIPSTNMPDKSIKCYGGVENRIIYIKDSNYTDAAVFKTAMSGIYLIYKLATPTTPTITEVQFNALLSAFNISGEAFKIPFDTPIYGGSYNCLTGVVTSNKDSGGGDISPSYQQTATANCEINLGVNNIWADTGDTTLQYIKIGGNT